MRYAADSGDQAKLYFCRLSGLSKMTNTFDKEIIPVDEAKRFSALQSYAVLDGYPDKFFNEQASIIAKVFHAPIALISLVGNEHVEFKGNFGMEGTTIVDRGISLCSLAILDDNPTVFEDATKEPCLLNNPLVAGEFGLQYYAGAPITTKDGFKIGTVCVLGKHPRKFTTDEIQLLSMFADSAMRELEARRILRVQHL